MKPAIHLLADDGTFPNSPLPALIYKAALGRGTADLPAAFEALFARHGWTGAWRNGLYTFHHYHSTAHEVLGVFSGVVHVQLGGPGGLTVDLSAGDVVVIPAGVAHKNVAASGDFQVVGAYPGGTSPDLRMGKPGERPATDRTIAGLQVPVDPVAGASGALGDLWRRRP